MKRNFSILFLLLVANCSFGQNKLIEETVLFENNKSIIVPKYQSKLDELIQNLTDQDNYSINLGGHTDNVGDLAFNQSLSERRTQAVKSYFLSKNITEDKLHCSFYGEEKPKADNDSPHGRLNNRRVEVTVSLSSIEEVSPKLALSDEETKVSSNSIEKLLELLKPPVDTFCISTRKDTVLVGREGTIVYVRKNSFDITDPDKCLKITIEERSKKSEIIRSNLSTVTTGEQIMVSQVMLNIEATYDGKPIEMIKDLTVYSPTDTILPNMKLFGGVTSAAGHIEWGPGTVISSIGDTFFIPCEEKFYDNCPLFFCRFGEFFKRKSIKTRIISPCQEKDSLLEAFEKEYGEVDFDKIKTIPKKELQYYVYNRRAGWSNLDWLSKIANPIPYEVHTKPDDNTLISVVFANQRSIVPLVKLDDIYFHPALPKNEPITIVGLRYVDDIPYLALEETQVKKKGFTDLTFIEYSIPEMIEKLKILD